MLKVLIKNVFYALVINKNSIKRGIEENNISQNDQTAHVYTIIVFFYILLYISFEKK